jgi:hypothetical protein
MGSILVRDEWSTAAPVEVAHRRLMSAFTAAGARPCGASESDLDLVVGNEGRLRLRGEQHTDLEDFPVRIQIALAASDTGTKVLVEQADAFDGVVRPELHARYELAMQHWAGRARAALAA